MLDSPAMKGLRTQVLVYLLVLLGLVACETPPPPGPTQSQSSPCPTATPGTPVPQSLIRPPVALYPNARNVQVATPVPPTWSLETPTVIYGRPRVTTRIT